ncbi:efflux RND transporter periplasmic adaptor subunit [Temperatibacter marinus]|uniref:Efflux RND transporter periplasmic adaptor subunit n=1 Tax=Temperatibacter marinus TaxID=1456591 RepID=A0AA52EBX6_9PROT|nr:efflux RND transporter periplasmic adaptor subunit [Temperatibacter marinus]WND02537.1 efflux RND transporter periplasmic adaptor subunit [Temperatibacter marinus]
MSRTTGILTVIVIMLSTGSLWLLFGSNDEERKRGRGGRIVTVKVDPVKEREFSDIVEAIGNAKARESVVLTSRVTDTVSKVHFADGQVVSKGDLIVELTRDEELAQLSEAKANLLEAEKQFERIRDLVDQGNASTAALETSQRRRSEANYRLKAIEARLADRTVIAPFDGVLGLRQVSEGSLINQNTAITTIDAIDKIKLDFSVPERFISALAVGQQVSTKVDAYRGDLFKGVVQSVDSRIDPVTRAVKVRALVDNSELKLRPGMLMTVELISRTWVAPFVNEQSILPLAGNQYLYVIDDKGKAERRLVTLGLRRAGYVEVKSGVSVGDRVVIEGVMRLGRRGGKVVILNEKGEKGANLAGSHEKYKKKTTGF